MADPTRSVPGEMFEGKYLRDLDPWRYEASDYEQAKYLATLDALPRRRYRSALEIGCSIGVFTAMLAPRCERLLAVDISPTAVARARDRNIPGVTVQVMTIPDEFPDQAFDLMILSEVGYYWNEPDLLRVRNLVVDHLEPGGHLVLVHWTAEIDDAPLTGNIVHERFGESPLLVPITSRREARYRLDLIEKRQP